MSLNRKGSEEGLSWPVEAIIIILVLIVLFLAFYASTTSAWGKTKAGADKFFEKTESGIRLYKEYFGDNPSKEVIKAGLIKNFIITNLSRIENKDCIGYLDLSMINEDISDYSVYFKKNNDKTEFYVYGGDYDKYEEVLKNTLASGSLDVIVFSNEFLRPREFYEFEISKGFNEIYNPDGTGKAQGILIKNKHPYFLRYKDKGIRFLFWNEEDKINDLSISKC